LAGLEDFAEKLVERLAKHHSWAALESYLRWVANEEAIAKNINDLAAEGTGKLVELTIMYKKSGVVVFLRRKRLERA
jgi:hypothetical protein